MWPSNNGHVICTSTLVRLVQPNTLNYKKVQNRANNAHYQLCSALRSCISVSVCCVYRFYYDHTLYIIRMLLSVNCWWMYSQTSWFLWRGCRKHRRLPVGFWPMSLRRVCCSCPPPVWPVYSPRSVFVGQPCYPPLSTEQPINSIEVSHMSNYNINS